MFSCRSPRALLLFRFEFLCAARFQSRFKLTLCGANPCCSLRAAFGYDSNTPDVFLPAYRENGLFLVPFVVYVLINNYILTGVLTAVIYEKYKGTFCFHSLGPSFFIASAA